MPLVDFRELTNDTVTGESSAIIRERVAHAREIQVARHKSANLIDSPAAATLGLHRALFYNEHLGTLETFRPYALPDSIWLEDLKHSPRQKISDAQWDRVDIHVRRFP